MLVRAAHALDDLRADIVFVGGAIVELLITDQAAPPVRPTKDIDVVVQVATLAEYYKVADRMRALGFSEDDQDNVICRWRGHNLIVDVMPAREEVLGFSNRWYESAMQNSRGLGINFSSVRRYPFLGKPKILAASDGLEPPTPSLGRRRSIP